MNSFTKSGSIPNLMVRCFLVFVLLAPWAMISGLSLYQKRSAELRGHSHFDAMTKYWKLQGWGEYEAECPQDHEPYPDEWAAIQRTFLDGRD
ncbi:hypothetical protein [Rhizobium ruizarguesonis]|uniref:hypothetical protein n=1 Tax=Rhizobium ruizarguesonis TaxID=2081791 RepID=UPI001FDFE54C|nr:hypothetical protein [Rhizobium ruizarguesonis]